MRKIILGVILLTLIIFACYDRFITQFVWVNPNVNTNSFVHISKVIKAIDNSMKNAKNYCGKDISIIYNNAYGSGFLKGNSIPNDLDYAVGVHLGKFSYNGKNAEEIATEIDKRMTQFQQEFYNNVEIFPNNSLYSNNDISPLDYVIIKKNQANIRSMAQNIPHLFEHKMYTTYTNKIFYDEDKKEYPILFPFTLKENEILIENYNPIKLYTDEIKYNKKTAKFLREITIVIDFYADIEKDDDVVTTEIVAESFTGQRLQLSRRFFVPIVFTGNNSAKYLNNLVLLNDNNKYIEYRLFNFQRHLNEFSNLKELKDRPIKLFKRVLQCTDLIMPLLDEKIKNDITKTITENLNNEKIILINDYETAVSSLIDITMMKNMFFKLQKDGKINDHIVKINELSNLMGNATFLNKDEYQTVKTFTETLTNQIKTIETIEDLEIYNNSLMTNSVPVYLLLNDKIQTNLSDYSNIIKYIDVFGKIFTGAGFHKIDMCWLDKNLIGVVRDDYTKNVKDLKAMAKANRLPDVEYKLINRSTLSGPKVRYSIWVRYGATPAEEKNWHEMKTKLLKDKNNFKLKRKFSL